MSGFSRKREVSGTPSPTPKVVWSCIFAPPGGIRPSSEKGKPAVRRGRKAYGPRQRAYRPEVAGLPLDIELARVSRFQVEEGAGALTHNRNEATRSLPGLRAGRPARYVRHERR